jgi:hypothetical protein
MDEQTSKDLLQAKEYKEMQETIKNSRNLMRMHTNNIPDMDTLEDPNKGQWIEHDEDDFSEMFNGLLDYCNDESEYSTLDWNTVNYEVYGADWYSERFPGFDDKVYDILAKSTEKDSKILDHRIPSLKVDNREVTLSFT